MAANAKKKVQVEAEPDPITGAAKRAVDESNGDVQEATTLLLKMAEQDDTLYRALVGPHVRRICYEAVRGRVRQERAVIWLAPNYDKAGGADRARAHAEHSLMDFVVPYAGRLGDCKRDDITRGAEAYRKQAEDMAHKARWLDLIAQGLTGRRTVAKHYTESRLRELQEEAAHA